MEFFDTTDITIMSSISFLVAALYYYTKSWGDWSQTTTRELNKRFFLNILFAIIIYVISFIVLFYSTKFILNYFYYP